MADLITGLFHDRAEAEQAVNDLQNLGYSQNDISVMMNDAGEAGDFAEHTGTKAAEGAGVGAGIGGTLGAIIAALTATGSVAAVAATGGLAAPLVAGPLAAALAGAGAGGLTGGIIGGLVGAGIPEAPGARVRDRPERRRHPARRPRHRRAGPRSPPHPGARRRGGRARPLRLPGEHGHPDRLRGRGPRRRRDGLDATRRTTVQPRRSVPDTVDLGIRMRPAREVTGETPERLQLREEQLRADTQQVSTGEVHVHKEIITETKTIDVPVTREEVVIERRAVGTAVTGNAADFGQTDQEIRIPVMEEQVTIEKTPVVREEVEIGKRQVTETQHLTGTVQREELRVDDPTDHRSPMLDADEAVTSSTTNR